MFCERIANDAWRLLEMVSAAGETAEVVIEATYGWYWAVDVLRDAGFSVYLAHPSGNDWGNRHGGDGRLDRPMVRYREHCRARARRRSHRSFGERVALGRLGMEYGATRRVCQRPQMIRIT